jgi:hypothetical protein
MNSSLKTMKPHYRVSPMGNQWIADDKRKYGLYDHANRRFMASKDEWRGDAPKWFVPVVTVG